MMKSEHLDRRTDVEEFDSDESSGRRRSSSSDSAAESMSGSSASNDSFRSNSSEEMSSSNSNSSEDLSNRSDLDCTDDSINSEDSSTAADSQQSVFIGNTNTTLTMDRSTDDEDSSSGSDSESSDCVDAAYTESNSMEDDDAECNSLDEEEDDADHVNDHPFSFVLDTVADTFAGNDTFAIYSTDTELRNSGDLDSDSVEHDGATFEESNTSDEEAEDANGVKDHPFNFVLETVADTIASADAFALYRVAGTELIDSGDLDSSESIYSGSGYSAKNDHFDDVSSSMISSCFSDDDEDDECGSAASDSHSDSEDSNNTNSQTSNSQSTNTHSSDSSCSSFITTSTKSEDGESRDIATPINDISNNSSGEEVSKKHSGEKAEAFNGTGYVSEEPAEQYDSSEGRSPTVLLVESTDERDCSPFSPFAPHSLTTMDSATVQSFLCATKLKVNDVLDKTTNNPTMQQNEDEIQFNSHVDVMTAFTSDDDKVDCWAADTNTQSLPCSATRDKLLAKDPDFTSLQDVASWPGVLCTRDEQHIPKVAFPHDNSSPALDASALIQEYVNNSKKRVVAILNEHTDSNNVHNLETVDDNDGNLMSMYTLSVNDPISLLEDTWSSQLKICESSESRYPFAALTHTTTDSVKGSLSILATNDESDNESYFTADDEHMTQESAISSKARDLHISPAIVGSTENVCPSPERGLDTDDTTEIFTDETCSVPTHSCEGNVAENPNPGDSADNTTSVVSIVEESEIECSTWLTVTLSDGENTISSSPAASDALERTKHCHDGDDHGSTVVEKYERDAIVSSSPSSLPRKEESAHETPANLTLILMGEVEAINCVSNPETASAAEIMCLSRNVDQSDAEDHVGGQDNNSSGTTEDFIEKVAQDSSSVESPKCRSPHGTTPEPNSESFQDPASLSLMIETTGILDDHTLEEPKCTSPSTLCSSSDINKCDTADSKEYFSLSPVTSGQHDPDSGETTIDTIHNTQSSTPTAIASVTESTCDPPADPFASSRFIFPVKEINKSSKSQCTPPDASTLIKAYVKASKKRVAAILGKALSTEDEDEGSPPVQTIARVGASFDVCATVERVDDQSVVDANTLVRVYVEESKKRVAAILGGASLEPLLQCSRSASVSVNECGKVPFSEDEGIPEQDIATETAANSEESTSVTTQNTSKVADKEEEVDGDAAPECTAANSIDLCVTNIETSHMQSTLVADGEGENVCDIAVELREGSSDLLVDGISEHLAEEASEEIRAYIRSSKSKGIDRPEIENDNAQIPSENRNAATDEISVGKTQEGSKRSSASSLVFHAKDFEISESPEKKSLAASCEVATECLEESSHDIITVDIANAASAKIRALVKSKRSMDDLDLCNSLATPKNDIENITTTRHIGASSCGSSQFDMIATDDTNETIATAYTFDASVLVASYVKASKRRVAAILGESFSTDEDENSSMSSWASQSVVVDAADAGALLQDDAGDVKQSSIACHNPDSSDVSPRLSARSEEDEANTSIVDADALVKEYINASKMRVAAILENEFQ